MTNFSFHRRQAPCLSVFLTFSLVTAALCASGMPWHTMTRIREDPDAHMRSCAECDPLLCVGDLELIADH